MDTPEIPDQPDPPGPDPSGADPSSQGPAVPGTSGSVPPQALPPELIAQMLAAQQQQQQAPPPLPPPAPPKRATHEDRAALIEALRKLRKSDALITYVTTTRPGLQAGMALDAIRRIFDHLPTTRVPVLDLFITSNGGDGVVPWRMMTLLREVADEVNVLVPANAFSAATLAALGADNIVMHPMGTLGPIDPTVADPFSADPQTGQPRPVSVEDVAAYVSLVRDDVGIRHEDELVQAFALLAKEIHPLTLGHAKRGTAQARMLGEKLLRLRDADMDQHQVDELLDHLTTKLHYHGHPINRVEAKALRLPVEEPNKTTAAAMWELFQIYEQDFEADQMFDALGEALATPGFTIAPGVWSAAVLPDKRLAVVESARRADVLDQTFRVAATIAGDGGIAANVASIGARWKVEV